MNQETFFGKYYFSLKSIWCAPRWRIRFSAPRNISGEQANSLCSPSLSLSMTRTLTCTHTPMRTRSHLRPQYYRLSKITSRSECREREKENCLEAKVRGRKSEEKTTLSLSLTHTVFRHSFYYNVQISLTLSQSRYPTPAHSRKQIEGAPVLRRLHQWERERHKYLRRNLSFPRSPSPLSLAAERGRTELIEFARALLYSTQFKERSSVSGTSLRFSNGRSNVKTPMADV